MKRILLVGASSAMARSTCKMLKQLGHSVIGISRSQIVEDYDEFYTVDDYLHDLPKIDGTIDGLVYFPGSIQLKSFTRLSIEDIRNEMDINVLGAVNTVQNYLPNLKQGELSSVVFISSIAAQTGMTFHASVSIVKGALESMTRSLAAEFAPAIRFNAVSPSLTETPLAGRLVATPEKIQQSGDRHPLKRIGQPNDLASAVTFLLLEQSSWMTGQVLSVDGGLGVIR